MTPLDLVESLIPISVVVFNIMVVYLVNHLVRMIRSYTRTPYIVAGMHIVYDSERRTIQCVLKNIGNEAAGVIIDGVSKGGVYTPSHPSFLHSPPYSTWANDNPELAKKINPGCMYIHNVYYTLMPGETVVMLSVTMSDLDVYASLLNAFADVIYKVRIRPRTSEPYEDNLWISVDTNRKQ